MKYTKEEMQERRKQAWQNAGLSHPFIFSKVIKNKELCILLLSILLPTLKIKDLKFVEYEKTIKEYADSRGVRLDIYTEDNDRIYNIEMQTINTGNFRKRTRYYQSMIDVSSLKKGLTKLADKKNSDKNSLDKNNLVKKSLGENSLEKNFEKSLEKQSYDNLQDSIIIFICTFDVFGENFPCYTFEYVCRENNKILLKDGTLKIFFNTTAFDKEINKNLKDLLAFINGNEITDNELIEKFKNAIDEIKYDEVLKGEFMSYTFALQDAFYDGMLEGKLEGKLEAQLKIARNILDLADDATIAKKTGLPLEKVQELRNKSLSMA